MKLRKILIRTKDLLNTIQGRGLRIASDSESSYLISLRIIPMKQRREIIKSDPPLLRVEQRFVNFLCPLPTVINHIVLPNQILSTAVADL